MIKKVLFISHPQAQCGVYEYGLDLFEAISQSTKYNFVRIEVDSAQALEDAVTKHRPFAVLYNYMPSVLPWIGQKIFFRLYKNNIARLKTINIGITHLTAQAVQDEATNYRKKYFIDWKKRYFSSLFDYYIVPDPTLLLKNPIVFKTGKMIRNYYNEFPMPSIPTIGSFGFGTSGKGFDKIVIKVQEEFNEAIIRLNIPFAKYGDENGERAKKIAEECRKLVYKKNIKLEITHDYWEKQQMLDFLAKNSINAFFYDDKNRLDISGAVDNALAARRPIAVSNNNMFRHILQMAPSVNIENNSLRQIIANGMAPLQKFYDEWDSKNNQWEYERILDTIERNEKNRVKPRMGIKRTIVSKILRFLSLPDKSFTWLRNTQSVTDDSLTTVKNISYKPVDIQKAHSLNRILNDEARALYKTADDALYQLVPKTMAKKIPRATVQQAFVFDSVFKTAQLLNNPKILCVGSYEDTASMALQRMGYEVEEIDPMINYFLQEFYTKPTTIKNSYDIVFSTSVIEHDPDDKSFIECISGLLAPGGIAVITCDYKDGWKPGDPKPEVDARFYTKLDLEQRLLSYIPECELIDTPDWDCPYPDFNYLGKYQYSFASFVIRKKSGQ
jgi:hypothetical protein